MTLVCVTVLVLLSPAPRTTLCVLTQYSVLECKFYKTCRVFRAHVLCSVCVCVCGRRWVSGTLLTDRGDNGCIIVKSINRPDLCVVYMTAVYTGWMYDAVIQFGRWLVGKHAQRWYDKWWNYSFYYHIAPLGSIFAFISLCRPELSVAHDW